MRVLFCTSKLPGAAIIRAVTWSDWSHVAIIDGEEVIEATWPAVRITPLAAQDAATAQAIADAILGAVAQIGAAL